MRNAPYLEGLSFSKENNAGVDDVLPLLITDLVRVGATSRKFRLVPRETVVGNA